MGTRTIDFRLNSKNRGNKEILDWLDSVVYDNEIYESLTEAVKWALLFFARGEVRCSEELDMMEAMQGFVRDFAKQSKADNEKIMQDAVTRILATIVGTMGQQVYGHMPAPVPMAGNAVNMPVPVTAGQTETVDKSEKVIVNRLELSDKPLDDDAMVSLSAMIVKGNCIKRWYSH